VLPFFAWKIFSISFFISLDFYLQVLEYLIALAEDFHVSIDYLLGRTDDRHN